jgi:hypothetical protein
MGDFESAALRSAANRWLLAGVGSNDETAAGNAMVALARAAADEIDRLRAELDAAARRVGRCEDVARAEREQRAHDDERHSRQMRTMRVQLDAVVSELAALAMAKTPPMCVVVIGNGDAAKAQRLSEAGERIEAEDA